MIIERNVPGQRNFGVIDSKGLWIAAEIGGMTGIGIYDPALKLVKVLPPGPDGSIKRAQMPCLAIGPNGWICSYQQGRKLAIETEAGPIALPDMFPIDTSAIFSSGHDFKVKFVDTLLNKIEFDITFTGIISNQTSTSNQNARFYKLPDHKWNDQTVYGEWVGQFFTTKEGDYQNENAFLAFPNGRPRNYAMIKLGTAYEPREVGFLLNGRTIFTTRGQFDVRIIEVPELEVMSPYPGSIPTPVPVPPTPVPPLPPPPVIPPVHPNPGVQMTLFPYDESQVTLFQKDVQAAYAEAGQSIDLANVVWAARMQYDAVTAGYTSARSKQLKDLRRALSLPPQ